MPRTPAPRIDPEVAKYAWLLALSSCLSILYQTAIAQEYSASILELRAGFQIVFGLVHIFYGAGMYLAWWVFRGGFKPKRMDLLFALTGAGALLSLLFTLKANPHGELALFYLPVSALLAAAVLTLFGMLFSGLLVWFHQERRELVGVAVALSLVGLVVAFMARSALVIHLGNNLLLVLVALCCLAPALQRHARWAVLVAVVVGACMPGLDGRIEKLRDTTERMAWHSYLDYLPRTEMLTFQPLLDAWSPYSKINLYEVPGTPRLGGVYNYYITWIFDGGPDRRRELLFSFIEPDDQVLCIAMGGGWPLLAIPVADRAQITGVELDPVVVQFFQDNPQYNDNLFNEIDVVRAEGRAALETLPGPYDAIVVDLPGSPATQKENPVEFENLLLTREGVERAFDLLDDDGVLLAYLLPHQIGSAYAVLQASGHDVALLHGPASNQGGTSHYMALNETFAVFASRSPGRAQEIAARILTQSEPGLILEPTAGQLKRYGGAEVSTDDMPHAQMRAYLKGEVTREKRTRAFGVVVKAAQVALGAMAFLSSLVILLIGRGREQREHYLFFFAIGVGMVMFQLYLYARFRSFFGDPVSTTMMTTLLLFGSNSLGSLFTNAAHRRPLSWPVRLVLVLAMLAGTHYALDVIPFGLTDPVLRFMLAGAVIVPFGFVSGLFFPLGLLRLHQRSLGWALALDGAGTFMGFLAFYFMAWSLGLSATMLPIAVCYALAALLLTRGSS